MELELADLTDFEVSFSGVVFTFEKTSERDVVFASSLIDYLNFQEGLRDTVVGKDRCISYAFSKLKAFTGQLTVKGESLTVERLKELVPTIKSAFTSKVALLWALEVLRRHGYFDSEKDEKKESTPPSES